VTITPFLFFSGLKNVYLFIFFSGEETQTLLAQDDWKIKYVLLLYRVFKLCHCMFLSEPSKTSSELTPG
jgi:hypothetical protein